MRRQQLMAVQWGKIVDQAAQAAAAAQEGFEFVQADAELARRLSGEGPPAAGATPFTVCAVPLPAEARVTERGFNLYLWTEHLKGALARLAQAGCRKLVWSDGRARVLPVEGELSVLKEQALQFLFLLCEMAGSFGVTVLVEPLGPRRTNFLNTMEETGEFLKRVGQPNLSSLISLREMGPLGLAPADLARHRDLIGHVQLDNTRAEGGARTSPRRGDGVDYRPFLHALREMGYGGGISLPADADGEALAYCRSLWDG